MGPTRRDSDLAILVASECRASAVSCRVVRRFRHSTELNGRVCASDLTPAAGVRPRPGPQVLLKGPVVSVTPRVARKHSADVYFAPYR